MKFWLFIVLFGVAAGMTACGTEESGRALYDTCDGFSDTCEPDGVFYGAQQCVQTEGASAPICTTECRVSQLVGEGTLSVGTCYDYPTPCDDYYFGCQTGCCEVTNTYLGGGSSGMGVDGWAYGEGHCVPSFGESEIDPRASGQGACGS